MQYLHNSSKINLDGITFLQVSNCTPGTYLWRGCGFGETHNNVILLLFHFYWCREYRYDDFIGNLIGNICVIFSWQLMDFHYLFCIFLLEQKIVISNNLSTILLIYSNTEEWKPSNSIIIVLLCGCYVYIFVLCTHLVFNQYNLFVHKHPHYN